jgi:hypothetical protein
MCYLLGFIKFYDEFAFALRKRAFGVCASARQLDNVLDRFQAINNNNNNKNNN